MSALDAWQDRIEARYDLSLSVRVSDHVFTDERQRMQLAAGAAREQLLVSLNGDELQMSLFLDPSLIAAAPHSLDALAAVLEGVSHFVCVAWRAERDATCTALELELQAEIDKFVLLLATHGPPEKLFASLFDNARFDPTLGSVLRQRYIDAHRSAAQACQWLLRHFEGKLERPEAYAWLRRLYRMSAQQKMALLGAL